MPMRSSLFAGAVALAVAAPTAAFAAGFGAHPMAPHVFNLPHQGQPQALNLQRQTRPQVSGRPQVFANHWRRPFPGSGYYGEPYSTLMSGAYDSAPSEEEDAGLMPPPVYGVPYYPPPPRP